MLISAHAGTGIGGSGTRTGGIGVTIQRKEAGYGQQFGSRRSGLRRLLQDEGLLRVIGLTVTDEDPDRGSCFLSADPDNEHHELALGEARGDDHPMGRRPKTTGVGQVSFIVESMDALKDLYQRLLAENVRIDQTVTHGISCSVYFFDPEDNRVELYYKTGYVVRQGFSRPIDLSNQSNEEILAFSKSFEATQGPFQGAKLPVSRS